MAKVYVLVSQGIEIYRTTDKNEAIKIMTQVNKEWNDYCIECAENNERSADNEIFMYEEDL